MYPIHSKNRLHGAPVIGTVPVVPPIVHGAGGTGAIGHGAVPATTSFTAGSPVIIYPYLHPAMQSTNPYQPYLNPYANYYPPFY
ncbi:hypothetical protein [Niallia sp. 01092]|uniref:hypothetical protein n=1 Tax=unclassified Niallia TaxID=2837522 RepID=UPI003FCF0EE0